MKQFEKVTQSVEALADFLSSKNKGDNVGCQGCASFEECTGGETCRREWMEFLNSEVEEPAENTRANGITVEISVDATQLDEAIEKANRLNELLELAQNKIDSLGAKQGTI